MFIQSRIDIAFIKNYDLSEYNIAKVIQLFSANVIYKKRME